MNRDGRNQWRYLDPETREPGYWSIFEARVLGLASPELERRRWMYGRATLSGVVTSWSRTLVPLAMAAAAAAALVIAGGPGVTEAGVERGSAQASVEVAADAGPSSPFEDETQLPVILTATVEGF